ncbi:MAG: UDP-3-O-(3-hydroxymyristoyl)glucosamine N-acyltransferase, partial [Gammaproteobacteria bacterium]|nr:UDP-3-O-(3-hydroxymyristoyl)glucosamine N-acyltransferase [Gammaproteobacteria bacterium]
LVANVTIYDDVQIGSRVLIHGGSVIGSDGFGNAKDGEKWVKIPQLGRVIVGDDVEIGANVAIDRGAIKDTLIGNGTKIDNLVHIAHNVQVGEHCAIAGLVGIAGSAKLGKNVAIGGASAMTGHITICDNVMFTGMSMITRSTREPGVYSSGMPAEPNAVWRKNVARFRRLEKLENKLKEMEDRLKSFEAEKV